MILLRALGLSSKQRGDCTASQDTANLTRASAAELLNNSGLLLTKATGVEEDSLVVSLQPLLATEGRLRSRKDSQSIESNFGFGKHLVRQMNRALLLRRNKKESGCL